MPQIPVVCLVGQREWRRRLEELLWSLDANVAGECLLSGVELVPVWTESLGEFGGYLLEHVHQPAPAGVLLVSDAFHEGSELSRLARVVRAACWSHGCASHLLSVGASGGARRSPFVAGVDMQRASDSEIVGDLLAAVARLDALSAPDGAWGEVSAGSRFHIAPVSSRELLGDCFRLRFRQARRLGLLTALHVDDAAAEMEADYHDGLAVHFAAIDRKTGGVAATTRLVLPHTGIGRLLPSSSPLWDAFHSHGEWYHSIVAEQFSAPMQRRLRDPGWAPLPMLNDVKPNENWKQLFERASGAAELSRFMVEPGYRGHGITQSLAHLVLAATLDLKRETLLVQCTPNHTRMYRGYGFEDLSRTYEGLNPESARGLLDSLAVSLDADPRMLEALSWDSELHRLVNEDVEELERGVEAVHRAPRDVAAASAPANENVRPAGIAAPPAMPELSHAPLALTGAPDYAPQPCYVLDANFRIVDWNGAFYHLFAEPFALHIGMHALCFVKQWTNVQEVMERSSRVFEAGRNPLLDTEVFFVDHLRYGRMRCQKTAQQLFDENGDRSLWAISVNLFEWEHAELDLFGELSAELEYDAGWDLMRIRSVQAFESSPQFQRAVTAVSEELRGADVLELYAAPGLLARALGARTELGSLAAHEANTRVLSLLSERVRQSRECRTFRGLKAELPAFDDSCTEAFDRVVSLWLGFHRDVYKFLEPVERLLRPGGALAFLSPAPGVGLVELFRLIHEDAGGSLDEGLERVLSRLDAEGNAVTPQTLARRLDRHGLVARDAIPLVGGRLLLHRADKPAMRATQPGGARVAAAGE